MEIETDKVNVAIEAPGSGILSSIRVQPGEEVPTGTVVAILLAEDEQVSPTPDSRMGAPTQQSMVEAPTAKRQPNGVGDRTSPRLTPASPKARQLAREHDMNLTNIDGSGPAGAVLTADVLQGIQALTPTGDATAAEYTSVPVTGMRKAIADRMQASYQAAPHVSLSLSIDMTETLHLYEQMKTVTREETGYDLTMTAVLARVISLALCEHPRLNAHFTGDEIREYQTVHLGIAVALDDGLVVPVIHHAEQKKLAQIQTELHGLTGQARAGRLDHRDVVGGTFTVSNLGMFGIERFTAILNPPQVGILSVGAIQDTPVGRDGQLVLRPVMQLTLNVDHRAVDGAVAALFLQQLRASFENPYGVLA
jgi:pyruvate dehydrogenase E2 component (dihydrolipoamide acetyltransferase)